MEIDVSKLRTDLPQVGVQPYRQVHAHSTGNRNSTVQNEADYHYRKDPELGFFSHVVGNGRVMQLGLHFGYQDCLAFFYQGVTEQ